MENLNISELAEILKIYSQTNDKKAIALILSIYIEKNVGGNLGIVERASQYFTFLS